MTIYEIDSQILNLIDYETGEIVDIETFEKLQMEREYKIEQICLWIKDLTAQAKAIKEEINNLDKMQKSAENKAESLKKFLAAILNGEKFKTSKTSVSYRKSDKVNILNERDFIEWAKINNNDLITYKEPTPSLSAIKDALKNGKDIPFATLEINQNLQIK
jgi:hypothetical protein